MRLATYGVITLSGSVSRPEPGADFADYQNSLASYRMTMSLKNRADAANEAPEKRLKRLAASVRETLDTQDKPEQ